MVLTHLGNTMSQNTLFVKGSQSKEEQVNEHRLVWVVLRGRRTGGILPYHLCHSKYNPKSYHKSIGGYVFVSR
jgi:hypothetical protein